MAVIEEIKLVTERHAVLLLLCELVHDIRLQQVNPVNVRQLLHSQFPDIATEFNRLLKTGAGVFRTFGKLAGKPPQGFILIFRPAKAVENIPCLVPHFGKMLLGYFDLQMAVVGLNATVDQIITDGHPFLTQVLKTLPGSPGQVVDAIAYP